MKGNNNKGITLIALVITIIVLLILAGVSIAMLSGNNGVLTKATQAQVDNKRGEAADKINTALNGAYTSLMSDAYIDGATLTTDTALEAQKIVDINGLDNEYVVSVNLGATEEDAEVIRITWVPGGAEKKGEKYAPHDDKNYKKFNGYLEGTIVISDKDADTNAGDSRYKINTAKITETHADETEEIPTAPGAAADTGTVIGK